MKATPSGLLFLCATLSSCAAPPRPVSAPAHEPYQNDGPWASRTHPGPEPPRRPARTHRARDEDYGRVTNMNFLLGVRHFDEDDWAPVDEHGTVGFDVDSYEIGEVLGLEFGASYSGDDGSASGIDFDFRLSEVHLGLRGTFDSGSIHPYVGAGGMLGYGDLDTSSGPLSASDEHVLPGGYVHAGVYYSGGGLNLGFDLRYARLADFELGGFDIDTDFAQAAVILGFRF